AGAGQRPVREWEGAATVVGAALSRSQAELANVAIEDDEGVAHSILFGEVLTAARIAAGAGRHLVVMMAELVEQDVQELEGAGGAFGEVDQGLAAPKGDGGHAEQSEDDTVFGDEGCVPDALDPPLPGAQGDDAGALVAEQAPATRGEHNA